MATRSIWKGVIGFGDLSVPVKLYAAVEEKRVHFRLLHEKDQTPVKQEMVNPETGAVVPSEEIRHGYETDDGRMVILTDRELASFEPEPSRHVEVIAFLPDSAVDHRWYDRPYFLGPDDDPESYSALAAALDSSGSVGLTRWTMRNKEYFGVLRLQAGYPVMITLRYEEEVVSLSELEIPTGRKVDRKELAMAEQLVDAMADTFDLSAYHDEYRERLMALIAAKAEGKVVALRKAAPKKAGGDLKKALQESLKAARERKSA